MAQPPKADWTERSAGVLLHPTSLPGGRIDEHAERFADWLRDAGFRVWQMLPVGTVDHYGSPYRPDSGSAGNDALFAHAPLPDADEVARFVERNRDWLDDYALFTALEHRYGGEEWPLWPESLRQREAAALRQARAELHRAIADVQAAQCRFEYQWQAFKRRVNARGLRIFGDVPLFLAQHSADVWAHREMFEVAADGSSAASMGVPPDAFTDDGQWWGFPPYRWDVMAAQDYRWWTRRFEINSRRADLIRIDHFRGLVQYWRIAHGASSAREGQWTPGPGRACIDALQPVLRGTRLVAEDLGYITDDVVAMREALGLPGMRVLQFAFDGDPRNPHLPHRHGSDTVCYTGTHDNDTALGWWQSRDDAQRARLCALVGHAQPQMPQALLELAWASPAPLAMCPLQDLLALGSEARMNLPGTTQDNWSWRFDAAALTPALAAKVRARLAAHRRLPA
jgi:4-alpha-glucanotransferase